MVFKRFRREAGLTLIELMVAMVLGLLVSAGIITVFMSTSKSNRVQTQLATLQESGRFAVTRIKNDLSMANGQYCTNSGGNAHPSTGGGYLDALRAPTVYAAGDALEGALSDLTTKFGSSPYPSQPTAAYMLPAYLSMRGYDCTLSACTPVDPHSLVDGIPAAGTDVGDRVKGTAVLTLRHLDQGSGWAILPTGSATGSTMAQQADGSLAITLNPLSGEGEPPASNFKSGDLAMLADCSNAQVFAASVAGSVVTSTGTGTDSGKNYAQPRGSQGLAAPRLYDFTRDYQTVTYYLRVVDDGSGHKTGALIRRVNGGDATRGGTEEELVRGVERLDFRYGVLDKSGKTEFLSAADVDKGTDASCSSTVVTPVGATDYGCLWRNVKSIEVDMLVDGQIPMPTLGAQDLAYTYATDGIITPKQPSAHGIKPSDQGFSDRMLRREFTALVSLRNFNP
jgi:type IV pilus assembly protein PilW